MAARDIDPAAAVTNLLHGDVRLDARGQGTGTHGVIELAGLDASSDGTTVKARGHFNTDGDIEAIASVNAPDLSRLRALGVKDLAGSLKLTAKIARRERVLDVDADATGKNLGFASRTTSARWRCTSGARTTSSATRR